MARADHCVALVPHCLHFCALTTCSRPRFSGLHQIFVTEFIPFAPYNESQDIVATRKAIVQTVLSLAQSLGLPSHTLSGALRFTGHSFRVTGAIFLASSGIDVWRIQLHGRWGSDTVLRYVRLAPLGNSLALEASLGRDLTEVRTAILDAKATLANLTSSGPCAADASDNLDQSLVAALGPVLSAPATYLGPPQLDQILSTAAVKGWHRFPGKAELLVANIGPPDYTGKLHALRPPRMNWTEPLPAMDDWLFDNKAWCSWDFMAAHSDGKRSEFCVWSGNEEGSQAPLCSRCFGKEDLRKQHVSSSSSSSASD